MLSPPRAKKLSSAPAAGTPSSSAKSAVSTASRMPRGATAVAVAARSGAGRAVRSSLPLGVTGSLSSTIRAAGTMWSGSRAMRPVISPVSGDPPAAGTT